MRNVLHNESLTIKKNCFFNLKMELSVFLFAFLLSAAGMGRIKSYQIGHRYAYPGKYEKAWHIEPYLGISVSDTMYCRVDVPYRVTV